MKREKWLHILRGLPLLLCVVLIGWYFLSGQTLDVATLREMIQTDHLFLTMLLCCALFAVKSLTIFFPITVLYILNGCFLRFWRLALAFWERQYAFLFRMEWVAFRAEKV